MDTTVEIYEAEKELREKRLAAYAEAIREKVQKDSERVIKELVEERYRQKKTQQEMADITGVMASNIARFERAGCMPTLIMLEKYANALGKHIEIRISEDKEWRAGSRYYITIIINDSIIIQLQYEVSSRSERKRVI